MAVRHFSLPSLPWHDVRSWAAAVDEDDGASEAGDGDDGAVPALADEVEERLTQGCGGWAVALYAYLVTLAILAGAAHGVTSVGLHVLDDDVPALRFWDWVLLGVCVVFFVYVEAFKGFHQSWSPWVARRCLMLPQALRFSAGSLLCALLAPLFAMGVFCASRKRLLIAYSLYPGIVVLIVLVKRLKDPYHQIVDLGVAAGISLGTLSLLYHFASAVWRGRLPADVDRLDAGGAGSQPLLA